MAISPTRNKACRIATLPASLRAWTKAVLAATHEMRLPTLAFGSVGMCESHAPDYRMNLRAANQDSARRDRDRTASYPISPSTLRMLPADAGMFASLLPYDRPSFSRAAEVPSAYCGIESRAQGSTVVRSQPSYSHARLAARSAIIA